MKTMSRYITHRFNTSDIHIHTHQVEYSTKATGDSIMTADSQPAKAEEEEEETGPDLDIDAI